MQEKAKIFMENLLRTNRGFNYFIDWRNTHDYEQFSIEFHAMDCLISKKDDKDFHDFFIKLLKKVPTVIFTFPYLFALAKVDRKSLYASNNNKLRLIGSEIDSNDYQEYSFAKDDICGGLTDKRITEYYEFFKQMGLKNLYQNMIEKSTTDYIIGVLVGLDSNGRKNRGGTAFELACKPIIQNICDKYGIELLLQKKLKVLSLYGISVNNDMKERKADFILLKTSKKIVMNIEVNFFNGGGSKPEEIIDSYINRQRDLENDRINFALITDGLCWSGAQNQLNKGFRHLKCLVNYYLAKNGELESYIKEVFNK